MQWEDYTKFGVKFLRSVAG